MRHLHEHNKQSSFQVERCMQLRCLIRASQPPVYYKNTPFLVKYSPLTKNNLQVKLYKKKTSECLPWQKRPEPSLVWSALLEQVPTLLALPHRTL